jgi:UDP-4-amino-4-deoxy-L-arabinose-oxoglutarate aminotransferase
MAEMKARKIGTGLHFRAVHTHAYYRSMVPDVSSLANTQWNSDRIVSLPLFPDMEPSDVDRVVDAIASILDGARS